MDPNLPYQRMTAREAASRRLFDGLLGLLQPSVVCDVGAFNGDESARFARIVPESRIVAFEASENNIDEYWRDNARWSQLPQVSWEHMAVTDHSGTVTFNILDWGQASGGVDWSRGASSLRERLDDLKSRKSEVVATRLDDYFGDVSDDLFALWIDVEGALDQVLAGASSVLERTLLLRAEVERKTLWQGQTLAPDIKRHLERRGFACLGDTHLPDAYDQSDILYIRTDLLELMVPDTNR